MGHGLAYRCVAEGGNFEDKIKDPSKLKWKIWGVLKERDQLNGVIREQCPFCLQY